MLKFQLFDLKKLSLVNDGTMAYSLSLYFIWIPATAYDLCEHLCFAWSVIYVQFAICGWQS